MAPHCTTVRRTPRADAPSGLRRVVPEQPPVAFGRRVECLDMQHLDEFQALVQADAREVAERSLRHRFGRLSNTRILSVLRPAANKVDGLQGLSDADLLDRWFVEFSRLRSEMQRASREPGRRQG
jgi:hypothetical protein